MSYLLVHDDREYLRAAGEELQTDLGVLEIPDDVSDGDVLETHLGEAFVARRPRLPDLFDHLERTGAPMLPRDVGLVLGHTGIEAGDRVLDAGTGTGILAAALGRIHAEVVTYEQDPSFAEVASDNMRRAGVADRVDVRAGNVLDELDDVAAVDALTLDTADAPAVLERAPNVVRSGGPIAVYSPFVEHTRDVVEAARDAGLAGIDTMETIQRRMDFDERGSRPSTAGVGHTGYLTFARVP